MLGILAAALGPIFAKEIVEVARRKRYYLTRTLYGLVLLAALFVIWNEHLGRFGGRGSISHRALARMATDLFLAVSAIQFGAVVLFVPLLTCGVLAGEREARTLDLLFTTRLTDGQIVLGKLFSRLAVLASLILCGLPVLSLVSFFGGIDPEALWRSAAVTLLAALFVGAHAVYFSDVTRSPLGALVRTYWWLAIELAVVPGAAALLTYGLGTGLAATGMRAWADLLILTFLTALILTNPAVLFVAAVEGTMYDRAASALGDWYFPAAFVLPAAWSVVLIRRAIVHLRREPVPFALPRFARNDLAWEAYESFLDGLVVLRGASERSRLVGAIQNPLWVRARLARVFDREGHIGRVQFGAWLVALGALVLFALCAPRTLREPEGAWTFLGFAWAGVVLLGVLLAGASLAGDRVRGFLDLVLVTSLTGRDVIDGTLLAVGEHLRRVVWLPWVLVLFFVLTGASHPFGAVCSAVTATLFLALAVLYGVGSSLSARGVPAALIGAFVLPLAVNIGVAALMGVFGRSHGPALWIASAVLLVVGRWRLRRGAGGAAVCCYLLGVHLVLASLATGWAAWYFPPRELPGAALHPGFWTIMLLGDIHPGRAFSPTPWFAVLVCYWGALVVNFVWARLWLIRHFDRLASRGAAHPTARGSVPPARGGPTAKVVSAAAESAASSLARP